MITGVSLINIYERFRNTMTPTELKSMVALISEKAPWYFEPAQTVPKYRSDVDLNDVMRMLEILQRSGVLPPSQPERQAPVRRQPQIGRAHV